MTAITLDEWTRQRDAGAPVFAVGPVAAPSGLYADRTSAELAADEIDGTYIEWAGRTGHQVLTAGSAAEAGAFEPEAEMEASI